MRVYECMLRIHTSLKLSTLALAVSIPVASRADMFILPQRSARTFATEMANQTDQQTLIQKLLEPGVDVLTEFNQY